MKGIKKIIIILLMPCILLGFFNCSSAKKVGNTLPLEIGEAYYRESNSYINVYITIKSNPHNILLDSIYFQGKKTKLELENTSLAVGHFKTQSIQKQDIIMSSEPYAEYGNKVSKLPEKSVFDLKDDECVVSYKEKNKLKYFKLKNVIQK